MRGPTVDESAAWPSDVLIAEEWRDPRLLALLYANSAWGIGASCDAGEPIPRPASAPGPPDAPSLSLAWSSAWEQAIAAAARMPALLDLDEVRSRASMLAWVQSAPMSWEHHFPDYWEPEVFQRWVEATRPDDVAWPASTVDSLVAAWRSGLRAVVGLPTAAPFARALNGYTLLLSRRTREDPALLLDALRDFSHSRF